MFFFLGSLSWFCIINLVSAVRLCIIFASASILILLSLLLCILRIERSFPLLVLLSLLIFIISPYRSCSLNTVFFCINLAFFRLYFLIFLDIYYLISPYCFELCLSHNVHILPHYSFLFAFYLNPVPSSLYFSFFEGNDYDVLLSPLFPVIPYVIYYLFIIFIIYSHHPYFFELHLFW